MKNLNLNSSQLIAFANYTLEIEEIIEPWIEGVYNDGTNELAIVKFTRINLYKCFIMGVSPKKAAKMICKLYSCPNGKYSQYTF